MQNNDAFITIKQVPGGFIYCKVDLRLQVAEFDKKTRCHLRLVQLKKVVESIYADRRRPKGRARFPLWNPSGFVPTQVDG